MLILGCDTSTDYATFVVGNELGREFANETFKHQRDLSQRFYGSLDSVLSKAGVAFSDIDVLAVGVGPGSFTGVRVAVTSLKTLAQASSKHLIAIGTLDIYAKDADPQEEKLLAVVLPSRKGEIYFQCFDKLIPLAPPTVATHATFLSMLQDFAAPLTLCGQCSVLPESFDGFLKIEQTAPPASAFIQLAAQYYRSGVFSDPLHLAPVYAALPAISQHKHK